MPTEAATQRRPMTATTKQGADSEITPSQTAKGQFYIVAFVPNQTNFRPGNVVYRTADRVSRVGDGAEERLSWFQDMGFKFRRLQPGQQVVIEEE